MPQSNGENHHDRPTRPNYGERGATLLTKQLCREATDAAARCEAVLYGAMRDLRVRPSERMAREIAAGG
jgi:hypothetical protein